MKTRRRIATIGLVASLAKVNSRPSRKFDNDTQTAVANALIALANDPAKAASDYGHLTGTCCFCNRGLTDERSVSVGYGPICAQHFGLPWGDTLTATVMGGEKSPLSSLFFHQSHEKRLSKSWIGSKMPLVDMMSATF